MESKSNYLLSLLIVSIICQLWSTNVGAQETKGGEFVSFKSQSGAQTKGNSGRGSSFRESIESFRRNQQQIVQPQTNIVKETVSSSSSSTFVPQRPATLSQQLIIVEHQEQEQQQLNSVSQPQSEPATYGGVAGTPGVDFPDYISIPNTNFSCDGLPFNPGMYADESTGCQVYHLCYQARKESFLCGIGTVFNQAIMNCDFWHSVDCSKSSRYYNVNADFGKSLGEPSAAVANRQSKVSQVSVETLAELPVAAPIDRLDSSSVLEEKSFVSRTVGRPIPANAIKSSTEFSSSRIASAQGSRQNVATLNGKTSIRRQEQNVRNSEGLLSPARKQQFARTQQLDGGSGQFTSESSTRFKVMPGSEAQNMKSGQGSLSVGSSLIVADGGLPRPRQQVTLDKASLEKASNSKSNQEDGGWRPYFKSKHSSSTASPATTGQTSPPTTLAAAVSAPQPDQEPVFSSGQESAKQVSPSTSESPASSVGSEPDAGPAAVSATETPAIPTSTSPEPSSSASADSNQAELVTPSKSDPPPPTESPETASSPPSTTTEAPTSGSVGGPANESTEPASTSPDATTTSSPSTSPSTSTSSSPSVSTTTVSLSSTSKEDSSGVEYAASEGERPGEADKEDPERRKRAAAKKRKAAQLR